jgi:hypothetical protein
MVNLAEQSRWARVWIVHAALPKTPVLEASMLDRYTARALVEAGQMSSEEYLRLFGEELRAARDQLKAEREAQMRELALQAKQEAHISERQDDLQRQPR